MERNYWSSISSRTEELIWEVNGGLAGLATAQIDGVYLRVCPEVAQGLESQGIKEANQHCAGDVGQGQRLD